MRSFRVRRKAKNLVRHLTWWGLYLFSVFCLSITLVVLAVAFACSIYITIVENNAQWPYMVGIGLLFALSAFANWFRRQ